MVVGGAGLYFSSILFSLMNHPNRPIDLYSVLAHDDRKGTILRARVSIPAVAYVAKYVASGSCPAGLEDKHATKYGYLESDDVTRFPTPLEVELLLDGTMSVAFAGCLMSHSRLPNCRLWVCDRHGHGPQCEVWSTREIAIGEELTYDYYQFVHSQRERSHLLRQNHGIKESFFDLTKSCGPK